ncbi:hypothetical protein EBR96_04420, partial [bacterium]|nr:hypothetical protein [bacterium]
MVIVPRSFSIVVAADIADGIGQNGVLPWHLPKDMAYFKQITTAAPKGMKNGVILGRTTWESLPERFRPLPKRHNI